MGQRIKHHPEICNRINTLPFSGPTGFPCCVRFPCVHAVANTPAQRLGSYSLNHPAVSTFPDMAVGSACATTFSRSAQRSLTLRPAHSRCHQIATRFTGGFNHFVASIVAPVASGWSGSRVGLSPTGKRRLTTAHATCGHTIERGFTAIWG